MVKSASAFGRTGSQDFVLIRASGIILALYSAFLFIALLTMPAINHEALVGLFGNGFTKVATVIALIAVLIHAWIGTWQVITDYIKHALLRGALQFICVVVSIAYLVVGTAVVWGI